MTERKERRCVHPVQTKTAGVHTRQALSACPLHTELHQEPNEPKHQTDTHYRQNEPHQVLADQNSKLKTQAQQAITLLKEHADALNRASVRIKSLEHLMADLKRPSFTAS